jgi:ferredoxin-nitrite reductase
VGRITVAQLREVARLSDAYGAGDVRLTLDQNVIIPHVADALLPALLDEPLLETLSPEPGALWRNLVTCTGNDYCHYSLIDTKNRAVELVTELERRGVEAPEGTRIHMSGCVHACGKHHVADIGLQGANVRVGDCVEEAAEVFTHGALGADARLGERVTGKVLMTDMADTIEGLLHERVPAAVG